MKKTILFTLLIVAFALASCAPKPAATQAPAAPAAPAATAAPAKQTTVIWYVRSQNVENAWENTYAIPTFEKENPNIKVNLVIVPWADFDTKMDTMVAAGTPPDVWSHWGPSGFADYVARGLAADLTPFIQQDNYDLSDFNPAVLKIYNVGGKYYGIPMSIVGSNIFYNKDLFDKYGVPYPTTNWDDTSWTYDKFLDMCKALTHVTGDPATDVYGCGMDFWPNDAYAWMFGKDLYPDSAYQTGFAETSYLDDPLVVQAFQARQDIVWKLHYMPDPATVSGMGGDFQHTFRAQKTAVEVTGGWGWYQFSDIKDFHMGVAAIPYGNAARKDVQFADPWIMSSKTPHPQEAWTFFKFLISKETMASLSNVTHNPPVRLSLQQDWYKNVAASPLFQGMTEADVRAAFDGSLKYGKESPNHLLVRFDQLDQVVGAALDPIVNNKATAADTLPAANAKLTAALKQIETENKK